MEYKNWYKIFNDYSKKYDLKEKWIMYKFHHTYRVVEYAKEIGKSLSLNDKQIDIVVLSALLHDVARYEQYTLYKSFADSKIYDHGDRGCEILRENDFIKEFISDDKDIDIVLKAIKNHNKFKVEELNDEELLITNIVRDADKIDILVELATTINDNKLELDKELVNDIVNCRLPKRPKEPSDISNLLFYVAFIYDMNYKHSFEILEEKKAIKNKLDLLETYLPDNKEVNIMKETINRYIKEKLEC